MTSHVVSFSILVPDHDKLELLLTEPNTNFAFETQARFRVEELTYWVGPSYAFERGPLRLGLSAFALAHQSRLEHDIGFKFSQTEAGGALTHTYLTTVEELTGLSLTGLINLGLDASFHGASSSLLYSGEAKYPKDPRGVEIIDPDRALEPEETHEAQPIVNLNLGGEWIATPKWRVRLGLFTDQSVIDPEDYAARRVDALLRPSVDRVGLSFGLGWLKEKATTSLSVNYVFGSGEGYRLSELFTGPDSLAEVSSQTLTLILSGSAGL